MYTSASKVAFLAPTSNRLRPTDFENLLDVSASSKIMIGYDWVDYSEPVLIQAMRYSFKVSAGLIPAARQACVPVVTNANNNAPKLATTNTHHSSEIR